MRVCKLPTSKAEAPLVYTITTKMPLRAELRSEQVNVTLWESSSQGVLM